MARVPFGEIGTLGERTRDATRGEDGFKEQEAEAEGEGDREEERLILYWCLLANCNYASGLRRNMQVVVIFAASATV